MKKGITGVLCIALSLILSSSCVVQQSKVKKVQNEKRTQQAAANEMAVYTEEELQSLLKLNAPYNQTGSNQENITQINTGVPKNSYPSKEQVNVTQEITLTSSVTYRNPYTECALNAVFTGPYGEKMTVPGFWDGGETWRLRFAAPSEGNWSYVTECSNALDTGLHKKTGTVKASAYTGDNTLIERGRLRASDDQTYLTYKDGTPFFWLADTSWWLYSGRFKLNFSNRPDEYDSMFKGVVDKRAEAGYTVMNGQIWVDGYTASENEGGKVWLNLWQEPNTEYWKNVDERVSYIVSKGMMPVIGFTWGGGINAENLESFKVAARYAIARYASYPVLWAAGSEWNNGANTVDNYGRFGEYIRQTDPFMNLKGIHGITTSTSSDDGFREVYTNDYFRGQQWFDIVLSEGGHPNHFDYPYFSDWELYNNRDYKVVWLEHEAKYEDIWEIPGAQTREIAYLAMMNGSAGYSYGAEGLWQATFSTQDTFQTYNRPPTPWYDSINKIVGAEHMTHFKQVFTSMPWWKMKPANEIVEWGYDRKAQYSVCQPSATATPSRDWISVYYPLNNRAINTRTYPDTSHTISGLKSGSTYSAWWYDCQTGKYTEISKTVKANASGKFTLPKPADSLNKDYMLILRENTALDIGQELYQAAKAERKNLALLRVTGETSLPATSLISPNAQVFDPNPVQGTQGATGFKYLAYNPVTEIYSELVRDGITAQANNWGEWVWWHPTRQEAFISDNRIAGGPTNDAALVWTAPDAGEVVIESHPSWVNTLEDGKGATFAIWHNNTLLTEFRFNGVSYVSDNYVGAVTVKANDTIQIRATKNNEEPWKARTAQITMNTILIFTPTE